MKEKKRILGPHTHTHTQRGKKKKEACISADISLCVSLSCVRVYVCVCELWVLVSWLAETFCEGPGPFWRFNAQLLVVSRARLRVLVASQLKMKLVEVSRNGNTARTKTENSAPGVSQCVCVCVGASVPWSWTMPGECRATCGQACIMRTTILSPGCGLPLQINTKETRKSMQRQVAGNYVPAAWSFILETLVLFLLILSATLLFDRKQKNTQLRVFSTHFSSMVTSLCLEFLCFMDPSFECICLLRSQRTFPSNLACFVIFYDLSANDLAHTLCDRLLKISLAGVETQGIACQKGLASCAV